MSTRFATFMVDGRVGYGAVTDDGIVDLGRRLSGCPTLLDLIRTGVTEDAGHLIRGAHDYGHDDVKLLPPVRGGEKILCVGINYPERHAEYRDKKEGPKYPNLFVRFPGSFVGHAEALVRPKVSQQLDYEGEIVLVIGREARHVPRESALSILFGLTLGNDGSVRDWVRHGTLNVTQGKNFDRSGSIGPWIVPVEEVDPAQSLRLTTRVNGELRQQDTTDRLTWGFAELIHYITTFTTLKPGDLIFTGTPTGAGAHQNPPTWLKPGDVLEIDVPEIGVLRNGVADEG